MAPPPGTLRVGRYFTALIVLLGVLYTIVFFPGNRHTPKLGIDLVGGVRVIFTAKAPHGKTPASSAMNEARQILSDRVNGSGVTQSTVVIQGADQLVVSIPGGTGTDVAALGTAAVLNFRPLIAPAQPVSCGATPAKSSTTPSPASTSASGSGTGSATTHDFRNHRLDAPSPTTSATTSSGKATTAPASSAAGASSTGPAKPTKCYANPFAQVLRFDKKLKIPTTETEYSALTSTQKQEVAAALANFDCAAGQNERDVATSYFIACDSPRSPALGNGQRAAYLLGKVIVPGNQIADAIPVAPNAANGTTDWSVQLTLKSSGSARWGNWTSAHNTGGAKSGSPFQCGSTTATPCSLFVGFTLDGQVISAPITESAINGQATSITGGFTQGSATDLANQLRYGALPLSFRADSNEHVSATLGTSQLKSALLAGGIGLILVIIYSLAYYRALGLVTIASLAVSGALTYAMLVLLGKQIGFTLDLAGIAGFIVALGITADSFVVFFERIKDEVHDGRSLRVAVPRAWVRARRTILSADTVSFLAAVILYFFASADVKGFAFTLGMSTILDLVVVFLFTHPIVSVLSRSRSFGSARFTGLNAVREGGIVQSEAAPRSRPKRAAAPAARRADSTKRSSVAVLDDTDVEDDEPDTEADASTESAGSTESDDSLRRRTTPEPGTAAERAAARRARMRGQTAGDVEDKDGR